MTTCAYTHTHREREREREGERGSKRVSRSDMVVMVTGLITVWILELLGAALNDVGRRCFTSALETVARAAISKIRLASSLLLLRSTLSEDWQAGDMTEYSVVSLVLLSTTSRTSVTSLLSTHSQRTFTKQLLGRETASGCMLCTLRIRSLIVRTTGLAAVRVLQ